MSTGHENSAVTQATGLTQRAFLTNARLKISRLKVEKELGAVLKQVTEISSQALDVARVGVWFFDPPRDQLRCEELYDGKAQAHLGASTLKMSQLPVYCAAVREKRFVETDDARKEPLTQELSPYLDQHHITALLDAAIYRQGEVVGVVCHEHVGPPRAWKPEERQFAATVADLVGLFLETHDRLEAQAAQHQLELELKDARRLQALCRFAAGVSHDLGNLLGAVTNGVAVLEKSATPESREVLQLISDSAAQSAKLARQLLSLSKKEPLQPRMVEVKAVLASLEALAAAPLAPGCKLAFDAEPGLEVWADSTQLEQVLYNLVLNARDAMPRGGTVLVRAHPDPEEGFVELEVIDTGVGIPKENLEHIFDPFFTTRPSGTGIGLTVCELFATLHGGRIGVSSTVGEGSTFTVRWPSRPPAVLPAA